MNFEQLAAQNQSAEAALQECRQQIEIMRRKINSINGKLTQANDQLAEAEAMNSILNEVLKLKDAQITDTEVKLNNERAKLVQANRRILDLEAEKGENEKGLGILNVYDEEEKEEPNTLAS